MNTVSILWDACLRDSFANTSFVKVPPTNGVYFNSIYGHAGDTVSCTTSFMTGYDVFGHGISSLYNLLMDGGNTTYPKSRAFPTLPMLLQSLGIKTFLVGEDPLWLSFGYDWIADFSDIGLDDVSKDERKLKSNFIAELEEPFFVHLHLWSSHLRGQIGSVKVEGFDSKAQSTSLLDAHLRQFIIQLWESFPNTQILIWADHGDTINEKGEMRHAGFLHKDVQGVWAMLLKPDMDGFRVDSKLHAQADLFRLISDTYNVLDDKNIPRYAKNPLHTRRDKVWAGHWMADRVKRYPDGLVKQVDEMMEIDTDFHNHTKLYGHMIPVNHPPPGTEDVWPSEKVINRLKVLGYIE